MSPRPLTTFVKKKPVGSLLATELTLEFLCVCVSAQIPTRRCITTVTTTCAQPREFSILRRNKRSIRTRRLMKRKKYFTPTRNTFNRVCCKVGTSSALWAASLSFPRNCPATLSRAASGPHVSQRSLFYFCCCLPHRGVASYGAVDLPLWCVHSRMLRLFLNDSGFSVVAGKLGACFVRRIFRLCMALQLQQMRLAKSEESGDQRVFFSESLWTRLVYRQRLSRDRHFRSDARRSWSTTEHFYSEALPVSIAAGCAGR